MSQVAIYKIIHQDTGTVYYIGQTIRPEVRMCQHLSNQPAWVEKAMQCGHALTMEIIEWVDKPQAFVREAFWIRHYKATGSNLANKTFTKVDEVTKTLKIDANLHQKLRLNAAYEGCSLQSLAESMITTGLASLLARKQAKTGNPLRIRKGERV